MAKTSRTKGSKVAKKAAQGSRARGPKPSSWDLAAERSKALAKESEKAREKEAAKASKSGKVKKAPRGDAWEPPVKSKSPSKTSPAKRPRTRKTATPPPPGPGTSSPRTKATKKTATKTKPRVRDYKAEYQRRVERLEKEKGYSRSEARGHPRKKKGELGVSYGRKIAEDAILSKNPRERRQIRADLLKRFDIPFFEPERGFIGRREHRFGVGNGPADWHRRRALYEVIASHFERLFGVERSETFSLLFSP